MRRRLDHRLVAGEVRLARQHVHHLRAGDARDELQREGLQAGVRQLLQRRFVAVGVHEGDDCGAALVAGHIVGPADLQHEVGIAECVSGARFDLRAGIAIALVGEAGGRACARLDGDVRAEPDELLHGLRRRCDARLDGGVFLQDRDAHEAGARSAERNRHQDKAEHHHGDQRLDVALASSAR